MRLGGTIVGNYATMEEWEEMLVRSRFRAITAPFHCGTPERDIDAFMEIAARHDVMMAEVGVWKNVMDPDAGKAAEAMDFAKKQLALADRLRIPCCVNIVGTAGTAGWDAADRSNFLPETYEKIISMTREIIDAVEPQYAFYCIEPMPWMVPDGPDEYLRLIRDVDRPHFAAHMDFVNMINCPRRFLAAEEFIEACFEKLAPYIKSTHLKDSRLNPTALTTLLEECSPGEGCLDFEKVLKTIERTLPADAPVLLEHMQTEAEYRAAYDEVKRVADQAGIPI
ncbi:MAG: sugar phosphate isomerase/epimerase [Clostridia bacterium]|nr:sugar phosphate isomerase/epimerase [Clostridia bacterium]